MAGTAAGAAKATAARMAKAAARRAERERLAAVAVTVQDADEAESGTVEPLRELQLDGQGVKALVPMAVQTIREVLRKKDRGSLTARGNLSIRVLELDASMRKAGDRSADEQAALGLLAMMRQRAAGAVDAAILPAAVPGPEREEPVSMPAAVHSQQQAERQSDQPSVEPSSPPSTPSA